MKIVIFVIMKILFLDIDSVMIVYNFKKSDPPRNQFDMVDFDERCVHALNDIYLETNCKIVLSYDHRNDHSLFTLNKIFQYNGCIAEVIGITPISKKFNSMDLDNARADEVLMWIENKNIDIDKWVAVDDLYLVKDIFKNEMKDHFVYCTTGIHLVKGKIIELLS